MFLVKRTPSPCERQTVGWECPPAVPAVAHGRRFGTIGGILGVCEKGLDQGGKPGLLVVYVVDGRQITSVAELAG
jgi:hypothetical protein